MKLMHALKIKLYIFFNTKIGRLLLRALSNFVYVQNLPKSKNNKNKKFLVAITIDTESGYAKKNEERHWQILNPEAHIGFYKGIENWRNLLNGQDIKATFFLSTNYLSAKNEDYRKIADQLKLLLKEKHEIGLHLHPDSDLALQLCLKKKFDATSAKFYSKEDIKQIVALCKDLVKKNLRIAVFSFRWGNWALCTKAVEALQESGFKVDSSATPGIKGHANDKMAYDWSEVNLHYPWRLSLNDYQNTKKQNSKILEIPIATFNFFGLVLRADPVYSEMLNAAFDYYYKNADRSKKPFVFVVISHSIEGTYEDGTPTKVIKDMEKFIKHAKKSDVEFVTMEEACNRVR